MSKSKIRVSCTTCNASSELKTDDVIIDLGEDPKALYTCPKCEAYCQFLISNTTIKRLINAGVKTVDEISVWLVEELTGEELD